MASPAAQPRILLLGAGGRLGRLLRRAWMAAGQVGLTCQSRDPQQASPGFLLCPLTQAAALGARAGGHDAVIVLAGVTPAGGGDLALNTDLALAALEIARAAGIGRVLIASSAAVYGRGARAGGDGAFAEGDPLRPVSAYGAAKVAMERAVQGWSAAPGALGPQITVLRIGNVVGADTLFGGAAGDRAAPVALHRFADGAGPVRSYIGPAMLARVLAGLAALPVLPPVLNVAAPGPLPMAALLDAAGRRWCFTPAPPGAVQRAVLETGLLQALLPVPQAAAAEMIGDWRQFCGEAAPCR